MIHLNRFFGEVECDDNNVCDNKYIFIYRWTVTERSIVGAVSWFALGLESSCLVLCPGRSVPTEDSGGSVEASLKLEQLSNVRCAGMVLGLVNFCRFLRFFYWGSRQFCGG